MKGKKKPKSIAKIVEAAAVRLQLYVRIKASDDNGYVSCVTCGVTRHYLDRMQGGHFIPRGRIATKLEEENINTQCDTCNGPCGMTAAGNPIAYTKYMQDMRGQKWIDDIIIRSQQIKKYTRQEVAEFMAEINEKIRIQEERVC